MDTDQASNDVAAGSTDQKETLDFPVVGIGASAGGLGALRHFFEALPNDIAMGFVVIQHLSPDHESELANLLQTHSSMTVTQIEGGPSPIEPGHVYVIPPGKSLRIKDGKLVLSAPTAAHGYRAPIDDFLRSLAEDQGENAIGVVLSGTGTDGTLGLKMIKEAGGLTFAQDPEDAEYDGMPKSAVRTGLIDVVAPAGGLAQKLSQVRDMAERLQLPDSVEDLPDDDHEVLNRLFAQLRSRTGHDFSRYKRSTILRRLGRRLQVNEIEALSDYLAYVREHPEELDALFRDFLISVTSFFRDPDAFLALEHEVIPKLFAEKTEQDRVRVWVAGCATGEEAYSIAMLLCEYADGLDRAPELQVFASDIDEQAITFAREALYPETISADVSPERLTRFFRQEGNGYRAKKELREIVLFTSHNLIENPPFSRLDLVSCRNLLIYLERSIQDKVYERFHYALRPGGYLYLGGSESADGGTLFHAVGKRHRIYRRRDVTTPLVSFPASLLDATTPRKARTYGLSRRQPEHDGLESQYEAWTLQRYAPPRLLVDERYEILHVFGKGGRYLTDQEGPATHNVLQRILPGLRADLRSVLYRAFEHNEASDTRYFRVSVDGGERVVRLHVGPVQFDEDAPVMAEIVFFELEPSALAHTEAEVTTEDTDDPVVVRLEEELLRTRERLQASIEEHETSNEELRASNEELQSMNEELQSTTEELETSKEELQSMNEELLTVNQELKTKIEELGRAYSDLQNLMATTEIATLFLDRQLHLKRFTPKSTDLFHIIPSDIGRPFDHITHTIDHINLGGLATQVLTSLHPVEEEVQNRDGRWFLLRMSPYRTIEDYIEGVVVTFVDVTDLKATQMELDERVRQQVAVADLGQIALSDTSLDTLFEEACRRVSTVLGNEMCKVLELAPDGQSLLLHTGIGWKEGLVGTASVDTGRESQAGYTLDTDGPVIVEDFAHETRFVAPPLLTAHDVVSGMSVVIPSPDGPYGVLGTHSRTAKTVTEEDARFLQAVAHILGEAILRTQKTTALKESEERLRLALDGGMLGSWSRDLQDHTISFDERCRTLFHLPPSLSGDEATVPVHPEDRETVEAAIARATDPATPDDLYQIDHRLLLQDGSACWLSVRGRAYFDGEGPDRIPCYLSGVALDISERKETERLLAENAATIRAQLDEIETIYATVPIGMAFNDTDLRFRRINERMAAINGAPVEAHLGKTLREILPEIANDIEPTYRAVLESGRPIFDKEIRGTTPAHPDEERIWLCSYVPQRDSDGHIIGVNALVLDVTDERKTRENLAASRQLLANEQARLQTVLEQLPAGVIIVDADNEMPIFINDAAKSLAKKSTLWNEHGEAFERWIPRTPDGSLYAEEDLPLLRAINDGEVILSETILYPLPDGEWLHLQINAGPVRNAEGAIIAGVCAFQDVTDLRRTQNALATLNASLEERVDERTEQVRALSTALSRAEQQERARIAQILHDDLQQLLYGLRLKLDILRDELDSEQLELAEVSDQLERGSVLLLQALDVARTLTLELKPPILQEEGLDASLSWLAEHMMETHGLNVRLNTEHPLPIRDANLHTLLIQIVRELLFNVVKHTGKGHAQVIAHMTTERVIISVRDEGSGFDFSQVLQNQQLGHSGFGLQSIGERLALFGGKLDVVSSEDAGTRITLSLPLTPLFATPDSSS